MSVGSTNTTSEEVNTASVENKTTETASAEETAAEVSADVSCVIGLLLLVYIMYLNSLVLQKT